METEWYELRTPAAKLTVVARNREEPAFFIEKAREILEVVEKRLEAEK